MAATENKPSVPALLPWIPPGKNPKESSSNVLVNKKNSAPYDFGSSIAHSTIFKQPKKRTVSLKQNFWSPKKNSRKLTLGQDKERRIESLLNSSVNSEAERELLRNRIRGIFDEEEARESSRQMDSIHEDEESKKNKRRNSDPGSAIRKRVHPDKYNNSISREDDKEIYNPKHDNSNRNKTPYSSSKNQRSRHNAGSSRVMLAIFE